MKLNHCSYIQTSNLKDFLIRLKLLVKSVPFLNLHTVHDCIGLLKVKRILLGWGVPVDKWGKKFLLTHPPVTQNIGNAQNIGNVTHFLGKHCVRYHYFGVRYQYFCIPKIQVTDTEIMATDTKLMVTL